MISPEAIDELADLVSVGGSVRSALAAWDERVNDDEATAVARRARLGLSLNDCLAPLGHQTLATAIGAHGSHGGRLAPTLRAIAEAMRRRRDLELDGIAAATPTKLSSRLIGALGLCCLVVPLWGGGSAASIFGTILVSSGLVAVGIAWTKRLLPPPPVDDVAATCAEMVAAFVEAGCGLSTAVDLALPSAAEVPRRMVTLGMTWPEAVARVGGREWSDVARVLEASRIDGIACSDRLRVVAHSIRERNRRACELRTKRAPVLLVLPLTLCFLPAFAISLVVPSIRGMAG